MAMAPVAACAATEASAAAAAAAATGRVEAGGGCVEARASRIATPAAIFAAVTALAELRPAAGAWQLPPVVAALVLALSVGPLVPALSEPSAVCGVAGDGILGAGVANSTLAEAPPEATSVFAAAAGMSVGAAAEKHIKNILNNVMFCSMPRCAHHLI